MMQFWSFTTLFEKEVRRFTSVWSQTLLTPLVSSLLYMFVFGVSLTRVVGDHYFQFLVSGLVAMGVLNGGVNNSSSSIMTSKFHNDLQDLRIIPISVQWRTLAYILAGTVRGLVAGLMVWLAGAILFSIWKGSLLPVANLGIFLLFAVIGAVIFSCIGIWAGFRSSSFDQLNVILQFILLPLMYLGGVFFSTQDLPPTWQFISHLNPVFYLINGMRWGLLNHGDASLWHCLGASILGMVLSVFLAAQGVAKGNYSRF